MPFLCEWMMPDNTGGGMKLSVGIGLNLTGFEALTQITKELETLQQMALKTEQAFRNMGASLRQTMNMGTAEMGRAAERMERVSRSSRVPQGAALGTQYAFGFTGVGAGLRRETNNDRRLTQQRSREETSQRASRNNFLSNVMSPVAGVHPVDPAILARSRSNLGLETQKSRAIAASTLAIHEETAARKQAWNNLKTGIMAGIGVTAAFEAASLARSGLHAVGQLDERVAAMRMTGHSEDEIERTKRGAFGTPVHGVNAAERMFLGQEMAGILGKPVSDETTKGISVLARAITRITGQGDITSNSRNVLRSADSFGNLLDDSGQLDEKRLLNNAMAVERGIAVTQGFVKADTFMHNSRMAMAPLQALDVANNPHALAQFAVMNEDLGDRAGDTLNAMFSESMAGTSLSSDKGSMLMKHHLLNTSKMEPLMKLPGGSAKLLGFDALVGEGNFLDKLRNAHNVIAADVKAQHPNATPQQLQQLTLAEETTTFGRRAARGIEDVNSGTGGQEKVAKTEERLRKLGTTIEEIDNQSRNFNDGLLAVKASFEDLAIAMVSTGGVTRLLYGIADALETAAGFIEKHKAIASTLADIAGILATFLALKGALGGLKMLGGMFMGGAGAASAGGIAAGAAEAGGMAGLGLATETAILGLSRFNVALLAVSTVIATAIANKMGQQDLLDYAKNKGFTPTKKIAPPGPDATLGEKLDYKLGLQSGTSFENKQGELRSYGQIAKFKELEAQNKAIMAEGKYGKGFGGEDYTPPMATGTTAGSGAAAVHRRSWEHGATVGRTQTPIPLPGASYPPPGMSAYEFYKSGGGTSSAPGMHPTLSPSAAQTPHAAAAGLSAETTSALSQATMPEISKIGTSTITADRLVVGTVSGIGSGENKAPAASAASGASGTGSAIGKSSPAPSTTPEEMMLRYMPMSGSNAFRSSDVHSISGNNAIPSAHQGAGSSPATTLGFHGKGIKHFPTAQSSTPTPSIFGEANPFTNLPPGLQQPGTQAPMAIGGATSKGHSAGGGWKHASGGSDRGSAGIRGSTATAPAFTSAQQKDAAAASVKFWMSKGLTKNQAAGMAAQEIKESGGNPRAVGDGGLAHGLYQHHPDRIAAIKAGTGIDMLTADANQQREGAFWEMMHTEKKAWEGLKASSTPQEAGAAGSMLFERPADRMGEASSRGGLASRIAMDVPNVQGPQVNPEQADVPASSMHVTINSSHHLDGDQIASTVAEHFIGGGPTASPSATAFDSKALPLVPGASIPRW